jgi:hypothetical protein
MMSFARRIGRKHGSPRVVADGALPNDHRT